MHSEEPKLIIKPKIMSGFVTPSFINSMRLLSFQKLKVQKSYHEVTNFPQRLLHKNERYIRMIPEVLL